MYHSKSTPFFGRKQGLSRPAIDDLCVTIEPKLLSSYVKPQSEFIHNSAYMYVQHFLASGGMFPGDIGIQVHCPPGGKTTIAKTMDETVYTHHENYHRIVGDEPSFTAHQFYQLKMIPDIFVNQELRDLMHCYHFRALGTIILQAKLYGGVKRMTVYPISMRVYNLYLKSKGSMALAPYVFMRMPIRNHSIHSECHYGSLWRLAQHKYPNSSASGARCYD